MNYIPKPEALAVSSDASLSDIAAAVVANHADIADAIRIATEMVENRPALVSKLVADAVRMAVQTAVHVARVGLRKHTKAAWSLSENDAARATATHEARASLYDWPLPNSNVTLGNATAQDLARAAEFHASRAAGETAKAVMYRRIEKALGNHTGNVRAKLSEAKLARLVEGVSP